MDNRQIGNRIKSRRKELKFTLQEIADIVGVASSTIQRYENGTISQYKLPVLESIAKAINVNPTWLVKEDAPMNTDISDEIFLKSYKENVEKNTLRVTINMKSFNEYTDRKNMLLQYFDKLNKIGMDEAIKRVSELTEISKYTEGNGINLNECIKKDTNTKNNVTELITATSQKAPNTLEDLDITTLAAHDDDLTEEEKIEMDKRILEVLKKRQK